MRLGIKELIGFHRLRAGEATQQATLAKTSEERIEKNNFSLMYMKTIRMLEKLDALEG
jgi:hypothetical protein